MQLLNLLTTADSINTTVCSRALCQCSTGLSHFEQHQKRGRIFNYVWFVMYALCLDTENGFQNDLLMCYMHKQQCSPCTEVSRPAPNEFEVDKLHESNTQAASQSWLAQAKHYANICFASHPWFNSHLSETLKRLLLGEQNASLFGEKVGERREGIVFTFSSSISFCRMLSFWTMCLLCESNLDSISCFASSTLQIISDLKKYFSFLHLVHTEK